MTEPLFKKRIIYKSLCVYVYVAICEGYVYRGGIIFLLQISKKLLMSFNLKERAFKNANTEWSGFCLLLPWAWPWQKELLSFITEHRWFKFWLQSSSAVCWLEYLIPADLLVCFVVHVMAIARWRRMKLIIEGVCHGVVIIYHWISTG